MPGMDHTGARGAQMTEIIGGWDPMGMDDIQRGAQVLLSELDEDQREAARILQIRFGIQDVATYMSELRIQCNAILTGGGRAGS